MTDKSPTITDALPDEEPTGNLPIPPGSWHLGPTHSTVAFSCRWIVGRTRGRFKQFEGTVVIADEPSSSSVDVTIDAASFDTGSTTRDEHLRGADFFDVAAYPTVTFRSTSLRYERDSRWTMNGELTFRGVTQPITLDLEVHGTAIDLFGNTTAWFSARGELSRKAYGFTWNAPLAGGGLALGDRIVVELDIELQRPPEPTA